MRRETAFSRLLTEVFPVFLGPLAVRAEDAFWAVVLAGLETGGNARGP